MTSAPQPGLVLLLKRGARAARTCTAAAVHPVQLRLARVLCAQGGNQAWEASDELRGAWIAFEADVGAHEHGLCGLGFS